MLKRMMKQSFSLKPFHSDGSRPEISITGEIGRDLNLFSIRFVMTGNLSDIGIPAASNTPERRDRLWEETCFEFFISPKGAGHYWEFNLSPSGHWNVFRFESYRQGMQEEAAIRSLPFFVHAERDSLTISLDMELDVLITKYQPLDVAISSVIKTNDQKTGYWALLHCGVKPDFHCRESFLLNI